MFSTVSFERLLEVTAKDLNEIKHSLGEVYGDDTIDPEVKHVALADAFKTIDDWSSYFNKFKEIQDSKLDELSRENDHLVDENKRLNNELNQLTTNYNKQSVLLGNMQATVDYLNKLVDAKNDSSNMVQVDLVEMIEKLEKAVNLIDENAKALSLSRKLKTEPRVNMHGAEHPRYRNDIDNNSLVADYKSGMILKDLSSKYKISIPGVRNRLIDLGVYKPVYKNNKH